VDGDSGQLHCAVRLGSCSSELPDGGEARNSQDFGLHNDGLKIDNSIFDFLDQDISGSFAGKRSDGGFYLILQMTFHPDGQSEVVIVEGISILESFTDSPNTSQEHQGGDTGFTSLRKEGNRLIFFISDLLEAVSFGFRAERRVGKTDILIG
jgi:hypothetical protein